MLELDPTPQPVTTAPRPAPRGGRRRRDTPSPLLLASLVLLTTTTSVITSLGGSLVPMVAAEHAVSLGSAQWILTGPMLVGAVATPVLGRLGGTGRRRTVILVSLGVVALGLVVTALPTGFAGTVVGRLLQGVGMGLLPLSLAAARDALSAEAAPRALALLSVTATVGAGISYPLSAWIALSAGIAAAYWFALAVTVVTFALAWRTLPDASTTGSDSVHWAGAALLGGGTLLLLLALTQAPPLGATSIAVWAMVAAGVAVLASWVRATLRHPQPLVDLRLATHRAALPAHISAVTAGTAVYMMLALVMIQVQLPTSTGFGLGQPVTVAGLVLVPYAVLSFVGSRVSLTLGRRIGLDLVLPCGAALYCVAVTAYALGHGSVWAVAGVMTVAGFGSGFTFAAMPGLVLRAVPLAETGSALSFNVLLRFLGFAAGSSLATSLLALFADRVDYADAFSLTVWVNAALWVGTALVSIVLIPSRTRAAQQKESP
ncbi:MFS transporter [Nocardioides daphniae]|uniref:MFS transporter n=1 Tax=Nocardioides daphniae TaxID=402297 RepID=A0A4P7U8D3_9ACTN|nr:MFS transporter [Nocardioides daphniae]QCC76433.1 MFS transporter [Nocardioides daphniae]GGD06782.1 MFS transporter [Nocardioides daphniae]